MFSVLIMSTPISPTRWRALAELVLGCIIVTSPNFDLNNDKTFDDNDMQLLVGFGAILLEVTMSGTLYINFRRLLFHISNNEIEFVSNFLPFTFATSVPQHRQI